jgi:hypothetical protein
MSPVVVILLLLFFGRRQYAEESRSSSSNFENTRRKWIGLSQSIYCFIPLPSTLTYKYTNQSKSLTVTTNIRVARMVRMENVEKYTGGGSDGVKERRGVRRSKGLYFATTASATSLNIRRNHHDVRTSTEVN